MNLSSAVASDQLHWGFVHDPSILNPTKEMAWLPMLSYALLLAGPPYATMPMAEDVDYRAFSVFINITEYSGWLQDRMEWEIHPTIRPYHVLNPWTWLPEVGTLKSKPSSCVASCRVCMHADESRQCVARICRAA